MASEEEKKRAEAPSTVDLNTLPLETPDDGVFETYSNVINADWTLYDLRLRFGELMQVPNAELPSWKNQHGIVLERAAITLPWHQAKYLCNLLSGIIKNYETLNGELVSIKLPAAPTLQP